jgi:hypothetical protein
VVAQLLAFMLTGRVGGAEPAGGKRCPVWATIRAANAGKFTGTPNASPAEQMLDHLLTGLKAPIDTGPRQAEEEKGGAGKMILISVLLLALIGGGIAAWWFLTQKNPALASGTPTTDTEIPTSGETPPTTGEQPPPPTTPKPPDPTDPPGTLIELSKKNPQDPKVLAELDRLRKARKEAYTAARNGAVDAARLARELQDQIDQLVKAQNSPEPPK